MKYLFLLILSLFVVSCQDPQVDMKKPIIEMTHEQSFPQNCDVLYFGETATFSALFSDNEELGTYSVEIHHNFDHHSHSTDVMNCDLMPKRKAENPFVFIKGYGIPVGQTSHQTATEIELPTGNELGLFDEGDYHFFISLTDKQGWSTQKGISIKIMHKPID